ncbi:MAG: hypothetical protein EPO32_02310 [Anaerolineae bacterium]|nr:MAG: hypothetical protein EPO32_02310 [Anaerolineae bacterium]
MSHWKDTEPLPHSTLWDDLALLVNALPEAERARYHQNAMQYTHDLNSTLSLIVNAQDLLRRDLEAHPDLLPMLGLVEIIATGVRRARRHVTDMAIHFGDVIEVE